MPPKRLRYKREAESGEESAALAVFMSVCLLILLVFAFSVTYLSLGKEILPLFQSVLSKTWSKTDGKVIKTFTSTESFPCGGRYNRSCVRYVPNVVYSYSVGEVEYQGERINFSAVNTFKSKQESDDYLKFYDNQTVAVFYNSNDPQDSTLSQEYVYEFGDYQAGCCCGSVGILFALMFWLSVKDLIKIFRKKNK